VNQISIIIPTYNSAEHLEKCLRSIRELESEGKKLTFEVIVVDSGSKDETIEIAKKYANKIVIMPGISRGGARNLGADVAENQILAFLDSDCEITASWFKFCENLNNLDCAVTGPVILCKANTRIGEAIRCLLSDSFLTFGSYTFSPRKYKKEISEMPASNFLISKDIFKKVGGFSDFNFNEDTLFSKTLRKYRKIVYEPELKCIHHRCFKTLQHFAKYFFIYGKSYGKIAKKLGYARRYGFVSFTFLLMLIALSVSILLNVIYPVHLMVAFAIYFLIVFLYSLIRGFKLYSLIIPILFLVLVCSYCGGFLIGVIKIK
jgi:glycosyltransferase involved in cell wall biosynthesis